MKPMSDRGPKGAWGVPFTRHADPVAILARGSTVAPSVPLPPPKSRSFAEAARPPVAGQPPQTVDEHGADEPPAQQEPQLSDKQKRKQQQAQRRAWLSKMTPRERESYEMYLRQGQRERAKAQRQQQQAAEAEAARPNSEGTSVAMPKVIGTEASPPIQRPDRHVQYRLPCDVTVVSGAPASAHKHRAAMAVNSASSQVLAHGRRCKEREHKKAAKPTKLKKIILAERKRLFEDYESKLAAMMESVAAEASGPPEGVAADPGPPEGELGHNDEGSEQERVVDASISQQVEDMAIGDSEDEGEDVEAEGGGESPEHTSASPGVKEEDADNSAELPVGPTASSSGLRDSGVKGRIAAAARESKRRRQFVSMLDNLYHAVRTAVSKGNHKRVQSLKLLMLKIKTKLNRIMSSVTLEELQPVVKESDSTEIASQPVLPSGGREPPSQIGCKAEPAPASEDEADGNEVEVEDDVATAELTQPLRAPSFFPPLVVLGIKDHPAKQYIDLRAKEHFVPQNQPKTWRKKNNAHEEPAQAQEANAPIPPSSSSPGSVPQDNKRMVLKKYPPSGVRDYVNHVLTDDLDHQITSFLHVICERQRNLKKQQPLKFKARMQYVIGMKETLKFVRAQRVKLVFVAPDNEPIEPLNASVNKILQSCMEYHVPVVYCLNRHRLATALRRFGCFVSSVAIVSADGAYDTYRRIVDLARSAHEQYATILALHASCGQESETAQDGDGV